MSVDDVDEVYTSIVTDIAKLARQLTKTDPYELVNGPAALLMFADRLDGIVEGFGVHSSKPINKSIDMEDVP